MLIIYDPGLVQEVHQWSTYNVESVSSQPHKWKNVQDHTTNSRVLIVSYTVSKSSEIIWSQERIQIQY
jgi:hypothetical protein